MTEILTSRHNDLIDPMMHIWGWEIPIYLFLGGLSAGLVFINALMYLKEGKDASLSKGIQFAPFLAMILLSIGMLALFLDLEYKLHVYRFYLAFKPLSPMSWGSWILVLVYPISFLLGLGSLDKNYRRKILESKPIQTLHLISFLMCAFGKADQHRRLVAIFGIIIGAALGIYTGILLGTLSSEPVWNSPMLGPLFLASGISSSIALLLMWKHPEEDRHMLIKWDILVMLIEILILVLYFIGLVTGSAQNQIAFESLINGNHASAFWSLVILGGLVVPIIFEILEYRLKLPPILAPSLLVLCGGFALRWIIVMAGQASSLANIY